jgi:hypothetical protein
VSTTTDPTAEMERQYDDTVGRIKALFDDLEVIGDALAEHYNAEGTYANVEGFNHGRLSWPDPIEMIEPLDDEIRAYLAGRSNGRHEDHS